MKNFLLVLVITICATAAVAQAGSQTSNEPLAESLIAKSRAISDALKSKDLDQLKALLAEDFRSVGSEGKPHTKADLLDSAKEGELKDFLFYSPQFTQIDDGTALITYNLAIHRPEGDDGLAPRYQKISDLWVRQGSDWRLKFEQATPLRPID